MSESRAEREERLLKDEIQIINRSIMSFKIKIQDLRKDFNDYKDLRKRRLKNIKDLKYNPEQYFKEIDDESEPNNTPAS